MKTLIILRHGHAIQFAETDAHRNLSERGRREVLDAAMKLRGHLHADTLAIRSSPLVRAVQTAEIVAHAVGFEHAIEAYDAFTPEARVDDAAQKVRDCFERCDELIVATHEPLAGKLSAAFGGGKRPFETGEYRVLQVR